MRYEFDWDPAKAASNLAKHGVAFEDAIAVFHDPLALSRLDEDHGAGEERWITLGLGPDVRLLLVVHTYVERSDDRVTIRVMSARRASRREAAQYAEGL
jgi:uncharacterized DUF497 family protein